MLTDAELRELVAQNLPCPECGETMLAAGDKDHYSCPDCEQIYYRPPIMVARGGGTHE